MRVNHIPKHNEHYSASDIPELDSLQLQSITIENVSSYETIELKFDNQKPFSIICTQEGLNLTPITYLLEYLASVCAAEFDSENECSRIEFNYYNVNTKSKILYELKIVNNLIIGETLMINGTAAFYSNDTKEIPTIQLLSSKIVYLNLQYLEDMMYELQDDIDLMCSDKEIMKKINDILVNQIQFLDKDLIIGAAGELQFYDTTLERYSPLTQADRSTRTIVYLMFASYFAASDNRILVVDEFKGISAQAKIVIIALFTTFSTAFNSTSSLVIIDEEDFASYVENVLCNDRVHLAYSIDSTNYVTNRKLVDNRKQQQVLN